MTFCSKEGFAVVPIEKNRGRNKSLHVILWYSYTSQERTQTIGVSIYLTRDPLHESYFSSNFLQ